MELKISFKTDTSAQSFKFSGEPADILDGVTKRFTGVWGELKKLLEVNGGS